VGLGLRISGTAEEGFILFFFAGFVWFCFGVDCVGGRGFVSFVVCGFGRGGVGMDGRVDWYVWVFAWWLLRSLVWDEMGWGGVSTCMEAKRAIWREVLFGG
jgi:hypothetical protein